MKYLITAIALSFMLMGCTDEDSSTHALEAAGFTEIQFTGWSAFACGEGDTYHTGFSAVNPVGNRVNGTVCCGLVVKDCTLRF